MKQNKKIIIFALALIGLTGCTQDTTTTTDNSSSIVTNEETITDNSVNETKISESSIEAASSEIKTATEQSEIEELNSIVENDIENTINALVSEYDQLANDIDTYEKYVKSTDKIDNFYSKIEQTNEDLCLRMYDYSLSYAELIINSNKAFDEKYDDFEELFDVIYDDGGDDIFDGIYDGVLDDMFDTFYDDILGDYDDYAFDKNWYDVRSNEYKKWSSTRSNVYDFWSDFRSDVYDFYSDMRSEMYSEDTERANKKVTKFKEKKEKILQKLENGKQKESSESAIDLENTEISTQTTTSVENEQIKGIRPEFKETMDGYESFFDDYCEIMKKYNENPDDLSILMDYLEFMTKYEDEMTEIENLNADDLTDEEQKYILEVQNRINTKLLSVS